MDYTDHGTFYIFNSAQRTSGWLREKLARLTAASAYNIIYASPDRRKDMLNEILGIQERVFDDESMRRMEDGTNREPIARENFANEYNLTIKEYGLAVPKWDEYIGASIDGECSDGNLIEIKSPQFLYNDIRVIKFSQEYLGKKEFKILDVKGIVKSHHYDQMQMQMAILCKNKCYYDVDPVREKNTFRIVVDFDIDHWKRMYFHLKRIIELEMKPLCEKYGIFPYSPWKKDIED